MALQGIVERDSAGMEQYRCPHSRIHMEQRRSSRGMMYMVAKDMEFVLKPSL